MSDLRRSVIRLAHTRPELRPHLIPLLKKARMGQTEENGHIRWHRFAHALKVWDLTNAGKRGKMVSGVTLYDLDYLSDEERFGVNAVEAGLKRSNYQQILKALIALKQDTPSIKMELFKEKGIHVAPPGFKPLDLETPEYSLTSDYKGYSIRDKRDQYNLPACYNTGKQDIKRFYRWVTDNWPKLKRLTFNELTSLMSKEDFRFRSYCSMD